MTDLQKTIKSIATAFAIGLALTIILSIAGAISVVLGVFSGLSSENTASLTNNTLTFQNIESIDLNNGMYQVSIKEDDPSGLVYDETSGTYKPEGNEIKVVLENMPDTYKVEAKDGCLKLQPSEDGFHWFASNFLSNSEGHITLYLPKNFTSDEFILNCGMGSTKIEALNTKKLTINGDMGSIHGSNIICTEAIIDGGMGSLSLSDVFFNTTKIDGGAGSIQLSGHLGDKVNIDGGMGSIAVDFDDSKDNYHFTVDKGMGSVSVNHQKYENASLSNDGDKPIRIDGGMGSISLNFQDEE